jgi:5,10-methylenetetrahydromethanopterin reductase
MLRGEIVNYTGKSFSAEGVKLDYPTRADIPIFVAGRGDLTLKLSGERAEGLLISNMCSMEFAGRAATQVARSRSAAGRDGVARIVQYMPCAVRKDRKEALRLGKRAVGEMLPGFWALSQKVNSAKEGLFAGTDISDDEFETSVHRIKSGEDPVDVLDDKFARAFSLTGTPDECIARAAEYIEAGINELALTFDGHAAADDIALLGEALQQHLQ